MTDSLWTEERHAQLIDMVAQGLSRTVIALKMNCGFTRNAISGRIHRLGIAPPGNLAKPPPAPRKRKHKAVPLVPTIVDIVPLNRDIIEVGLRTECHYPVGFSDVHLFCGHPAQEGSSYCPHHHAVVWVKPIPVRNRERMQVVA